MEQAEPAKRTTAKILYETVSAYVDNNKRSGDVAERWLCLAVLEPLLPSISGILNSRPRNLDQAAISSFQAIEIEKVIAEKQKEIARLENDLKTAQRSAGKAA